MHTTGHLQRAAVSAVWKRYVIAGRSTANDLWWYESDVGWTGLGYQRFGCGQCHGGAEARGPW